MKALVSRTLYLVHRWLGIATCLLVLMWFVSGLVMLYVPFPKLTAEERLITWRQLWPKPYESARQRRKRLVPASSAAFEWR